MSIYSTISVTFGLPSVIVPVLSITTVSILWAVSRASPDFIRIPFSAPLPVPTIIATGVARPREQGQDITKTVMPAERANSNDAPLISHTIIVTRAIVITTGTNIPAILSAILAIGALLELASSTNLIIWFIVEFSPTFTALILIKPFLFIDAETTLSPTCFSTGILSPVMALWSTLVLPSTITPSTAMLSPGRIITISPTTSCSTGTVITWPFLSISASFGARATSFSIALLVFFLERLSRYLPRVISVTIIPADSKYKSILYVPTRSILPWPSPQLILKRANMP